MENKFNLIKINSDFSYGTNLQTVLECEDDLKNNYNKLGHPIAFGGINTIYSYYKGLLDKDKIKEILSGIENYTLHREYHKTERNPSYSHFKNQQWQMDLVDIQKLHEFNDGVRYLLTCIDTFTRKAFSRTLLTKEAQSVLNAFKSIINEAGGQPMVLVLDKGTEFNNQSFLEFCHENDIKIYTPDSSVHAAFIERFNRTFQKSLYQYMSENETHRYINIKEKNGNLIPVFDLILQTYNERKHSMTGYSPNKAYNDESTHLPIRIKMSKYYDKIKSRPVKFKIGDIVRVAIQKGKFSRGYNEQSKLEVFRIYKIIRKKIPMYILETYNGKEILIGSFYDSELTKVTGNIWRIEKVLKTKNGKHYVKWKGFDDSYNSWVDNKYIVRKF